MVVALTDTASSLGGMVALFVATLATSIQFNWRIAFWISSAIALAGTIAGLPFVKLQILLFSKIQNQRKIKPG
jgi:MFS family permease